MARIDVPFVVTGQQITQTPKVEIAAGGTNYFYAIFSLCETWEDIDNIKALFVRGDIVKVMDVVRTEDGVAECKVPWEVMTTPGYFDTGIFGGDRLPTGRARTFVTVGCGYDADADGTGSTPATPDWFYNVDQRLTMLEQASDNDSSDSLPEEDRPSEDMRPEDNPSTVVRPNVCSDPTVYLQETAPEDSKHGDFWARKVQVADEEDTDPVPPEDDPVSVEEMQEYVKTTVNTAIAAALKKLQFNETDPTVPEWAKAKEKPSYAANEIAANITVDEQQCKDVGAALNALANRSGGSSEKEWRLINVVEVTEPVGAIEIFKDSNGNDFEISDFIIYAPLNVTASANNMIYLHGMEPGAEIDNLYGSHWQNLGSSGNNAFQTTNKSFFIRSYWEGVRHTNHNATTYDYGTTHGSTNGITVRQNAPKNICALKIQIQYASNGETINTGTFYLYGR